MSEDRPAPAVTHVRAKDRSTTVPLAWPLEVDGKPLSSITLRRLTTKEVADYIDSVRGTDAVVRFPIFVDEAGAPIPDAVFDQLDDDDVVVLNERALDFLPRRWRPDASPPVTGDSTGPSSGE